MGLSSPGRCGTSETTPGGKGEAGLSAGWTVISWFAEWKVENCARFNRLAKEK